MRCGGEEQERERRYEDVIEGLGVEWGGVGWSVPLPCPKRPERKIRNYDDDDDGDDGVK